MIRQFMLATALIFPFSINRIPHEYIQADITTDVIRERRKDCIKYTLDEIRNEAIKLYYTANTKKQYLPELVEGDLENNLTRELQRYGINLTGDSCWFSPSIQNRIKGDVLSIRVYPNMKVKIEVRYRL